jgi:Flp pilus assembly pilin Flp
MAFVRYGVPVAFVALGVVMLIFGESAALDGFFMALGAALSVLFLNWLFRQGVKGDEDRVREEAARDYFTKHGHWPDERPRSR